MSEKWPFGTIVRGETAGIEMLVAMVINEQVPRKDDEMHANLLALRGTLTEHRGGFYEAGTVFEWWMGRAWWAVIE